MSGASYVFGKNSVRVLLESNPKRVQRVYISDTLRPDKRIDDIYRLTKTHGITLQKVGKTKLDNYLFEASSHADFQASFEASQEASNESLIIDGKENQNLSIQHQGVVALVAPKAFLQISELLKLAEDKIKAQEKPLLLMLDGITDPRNLGAILRVADGAGIMAVIIPKNNSAALGPAAAKTASGAEETVDVCLVPNLAQALEALKKSVFWVVGSTGDAKAQTYDRIKYDMPTVLVMGSEGDGMRPLITKNCDFLAKLPMAGVVDSLNVSVATGILAYHIRREQIAAINQE